MKQSTRYVLVKVRIDHREDVDPDEAIQECDYHFKTTDDGAGARITDTEIIGVTDKTTLF